MPEKNKIEVSKKIDNYVAYMFEHAMLEYTPNRELLKYHLKAKNIQKYDAFMQALYDEVGYLECNECAEEYSIEYRYNFISK